MAVRVLGKGVLRISPQLDKAGMGKAKNAIRNLRRSLNLTGRGTNKLGGAIRGVMLQFLGLAAAIKAVRGAVGTLATFDQLEASLTTIEGSAPVAKKVLNDLATFSKRTPFRMKKVTEAFIIMRARGLQVTMDDMEAIGNVAAGFGQDITSFANAVGQAIAGEAERLKMFGISAKFQGKQVEFTYNNVKTTVQRNAKDISEFLFQIGKTKFAGGIERQAQTIGGRFSTLMDNIELFIFKIGNAGLLDAMGDVILEFTKFFGTTEESEKAVFALATEIGERLANTLRKVQARIKEFREEFGELVTRIKETVEALGGIHKIMQAVTAAFATLFAIKGVLFAVEIIMAIGGAISALAAAIGGASIGTVVAIIAGAVAQLILMFLVIDDIIITIKGGDSVISRFWNWFTEEGPKATGILGQIWDILSMIYENWKTLGSFVIALGKQFWDLWGGVVIGVLEALWEVLKFTFSSIANGIQFIITVVLGMVQIIVGAFSIFLAALLAPEKLLTRLGEQGERVAQIFKNLFSILSDNFSIAGDLISNLGKIVGVEFNSNATMPTGGAAGAGGAPLAPGGMGPLTPPPSNVSESNSVNMQVNVDARGKDNPKEIGDAVATESGSAVSRANRKHRSQSAGGEL